MHATRAPSAAKVSGRVTYSQELLHEYGEIERPRGLGAERAGSGYSKI